MSTLKEWYNINQYRSYPFTKEFFNDWFLDAVFFLPITVKPLLKVSEVIITDKLFSLKIFDANNEYIGVFTYKGSEVVELFSTNDKYYGKIISRPSNLVPQIVAPEDVYFDLKTIKYYKAPENSIYTIIRPKKENSEISGDIIFNDGLTIQIEDDLTINSSQPIYPECKYAPPIQKINRVEPDENGIITIYSAHFALNINKIEPNNIKVSSVYQLVDFDKRALTAGRGNVGSPGNPGNNGFAGPIVSYPETDPITYGGFIYDNVEIRMNRTPVSKIAVIDKDNIMGVNEKYIYLLDKFPAIDIIYDEYRDITQMGENYFVATSTSTIKRYDKAGVLQENIVAPIDILGLYSISNNEFGLFGLNEIYAYNGSYFRKIEYPGFDIQTIVYEDTHIILSKIGSMYFEGGNFLDLPTSAPLTGYWEGYIISEDRHLYFTDGMIEATYDLTSKLNPTENLRSIHGVDDLVAVVGDAGYFSIYDNEIWTRIGTPPNKNWKTVFVLTKDKILVFGESI